MQKSSKKEYSMSQSDKKSTLPSLFITKSKISLYSWTDMQKISVVNVTNSKLDGQDSVNDTRMGVVSLTDPCDYCSEVDCPGHYGLINFRGHKIYNPAYIQEIVYVITSVCNTCSKLLVTEDVLKKEGILNLSYDKRLSKIAETCVNKQCLREEFLEEEIAQTGPIIPCQKNGRYSCNKEEGEIYVSPSNKKSDEKTLLDINTVYKILDKISEDDARILGFSKDSHPRNMILEGILVAPNVARPPVYDAGMISYDKLTLKYQSIVTIVNNIVTNNSTPKELYKAVRQLLFKTESPKIGPKDFLSVTERIQGKTALLRGLLMGKRNNHCGRTVAGPDSSLRYGQIRIPSVWAPILTKKERVTSFNIHKLSQLLEQGRITHIIPKGKKLRKYYNPSSKYKLQIGDTVERWLQTGDRIIINRQPTLHRQSMMAYEVVLGHQYTIGLHLSYTTPMNCDFDGDENNAWNPQDLEVEAEAEILMNVKNNIMSTENNKPIMALVMNSVSGAFLLSNPKVRVSDLLFSRLMSLISKEDSSLNYRLLKYGIHPRSGQAVFSALLPPDFYYNHKKVLILEGVLISGRITKSHVGTSSRSIVQELHKKYGPERTAKFLTEASWVINKWLIETGFSVGLRDMINLAIDPSTNKEYDKSQKILNEELAKIYLKLEALGGKLDDPVEEAFRQRQINNLVNIAQGIGMRIAKEVLTENNAIGVMTDQGAGTKGGLANVGQMFGAVGQQYYKGERLKATLTNGRRLLPTQDLDDNNPEVHGFISKSFMEGLTPEQLFFLQSGARESLLDTALKTSETGAMQRRMIKAFENIIIAYDGSIRNTLGTMFSPIYNGGYDVAQMLEIRTDDKPDFSSFIDLKAIVEELNFKRGWVPRNINEQITKQREQVKTAFSNIKLDITRPQHRILPQKEYSTKPVTYEPYKYKITKFEKARIIGTRAMQLSKNSTPKINIQEETDPIKIALKEYDQGLLSDFQVIRKYPDGSYEIIRPTVDNI